MTRTLYARKNQYPNLPGWTAYVTGWGPTEAEAIEDLEMKLEDE